MAFSDVATKVPEHVAPDLVRDYDWLDAKGEGDPARHFGRLGDQPDLFWTPHHGGHWVSTRYKDMAYIYSHPREFSSRHATLPPPPFQVPLQEFDGELHKKYRAVLQPFFMPKKIVELEQAARQLTVDLIEGFYAQGECEFVADFASHMPISLVMTLLGLPREDREYLMPLSEMVTRFQSYDERAEAFGKMIEYMRDKIIPARRANPGDDVFSVFMAARIDDQPISDEQIAQLGALLIGAGLDTVAGMLGFIAQYLADHPDQRRKLVAHPELHKDALEEMLRRFSLANMSRVVSDDIEFKGVQMKKGDLVLLPLTRAGLDPEQYVDPETVDFDRSIRAHLTFGRGPHQCIGASLARTELLVFLDEWLKRIPDFAVKPGHVVRARIGSANALEALPLVWPVTG